MSRPPSGSADAVTRALETAKTTQSAAELRRALAVTLPVMHGLSLQETASLLGRSETWVAKERRSFIKDLPGATATNARGGRRNQLIPADEEDAFMEMVCRKYMRARSEWRLGMTRGATAYQEVVKNFIDVVIEEIESKIQRKTTRTTAYNLMARVGRRRFADYKPDMWRIACEKQIPGGFYEPAGIPEYLANKFGLRIKKKRASKRAFS